MRILEVLYLWIDMNCIKDEHDMKERPHYKTITIVKMKTISS